MLMRADRALILPPAQKKNARSASGTKRSSLEKRPDDGRMFLPTDLSPCDPPCRMLASTSRFRPRKPVQQRRYRSAESTVPRLAPADSVVRSSLCSKAQTDNAIQPPLATTPISEFVAAVAPLPRGAFVPVPYYSTYDQRAFVSTSSRPLRSGEMAMAGRRDNACVLRMPSRMVLCFE